MLGCDITFCAVRKVVYRVLRDSKVEVATLVKGQSQRGENFSFLIGVTSLFHETQLVKSVNKMVPKSDKSCLLYCNNSKRLNSYHIVLLLYNWETRQGHYQVNGNLRSSLMRQHQILNAKFDRALSATYEAAF